MDADDGRDDQHLFHGRELDMREPPVEAEVRDHQPVEDIAEQLDISAKYFGIDVVNVSNS